MKNKVEWFLLSEKTPEVPRREKSIEVVVKFCGKNEYLTYTQRTRKVRNKMEWVTSHAFHDSFGTLYYGIEKWRYYET